MNTFTYNISSADNFEGSTTLLVANNAQTVTIIISGLPQHRYYKCLVKNFIINPASFTTGSTAGRFAILASPNFSGNGLIMSGNRGNQIIASCDLNSGINNQVNTVFYIENVNGKSIIFYLQDEFGVNIPLTRLNQNTFNTQWYLTMELTPVDDIYGTNQQLKNGL